MSGCHTPPRENLRIPIATPGRHEEPELIPPGSRATPVAGHASVIPGPAPSIDLRPGLAQIVDEVNSSLQDVFFGFDSEELTPAALTAIRHDSDLLKPVLNDYPSLTLRIEGHCDERGSAEYNLALGDRRARRVSEAIQESSALLANIEVISFGKEAPQCTEPVESCWQRNRRAHLALRK